MTSAKREHYTVLLPLGDLYDDHPTFGQVGDLAVEIDRDAKTAVATFTDAEGRTVRIEYAITASRYEF